jgi:recombination protein RecT
MPKDSKTHQRALPEKTQAEPTTRGNEVTTPKVLAAMIEKRRGAFSAIAGAHLRPERLIKLGQAALSRVPHLVECTPSSVLVCLIRCAELGLEPDAALPQRRLYLIPRWNERLKPSPAYEATYVIDYRAKMQLARDTGLVSAIVADVVFERDGWTYEKSVEGESVVKFRHAPDAFADDRGAIRGYYAATRLENGEVHVAVMSLKEAQIFRDRHAPRRSGAITGPWVSDFNSMALKTCLNRLTNLLPAGEKKEAQVFAARLQEEARLEEGASLPDLDLELGLPSPGATTGDELANSLAGQPSAQTKKEPKPNSPEDVGEREPGQEG